MPVGCVEKTSEERAHFEIYRIGAACARPRLMTPEKNLYNMKTDAPDLTGGDILEREFLPAEGKTPLAAREGSVAGVQPEPVSYAHLLFKGAEWRN